MEGWPAACREEKGAFSGRWKIFLREKEKLGLQVQGVTVAAEIVGGANTGKKKRYGQRGCLREASEKSLVRGSFCLVVFRGEF